MTVARSIALSAGESSGDLNGSFLVEELRRIDPELQFWAAGGPRMRASGVEVAVDMSGSGTIGIAETLKLAPRIVRQYFKMRWLLVHKRPDLFIPIDFGAFNIRLAQIAHKSGIPVVYYFPPSSWRRKPRNGLRLLACGGKVVTPFPWSAEALAAAGVDARFVGHPLVDIVKPTCSREEFLRELGLDPGVRTIALLPGSRAHEIREHLGPLLGCAQRLRRELGQLQFVIGAAWGAESMRRKIKDHPAIADVAKVVESRTYDCLNAADLLITASGTATLEAAILGVPMVIIYRGSPIMRLEYNLRKSVLEEFIGMPNIVADRGVCPELLNEDVTPEKLADIARSLLTVEGSLNSMRKDLTEISSRLGTSGAVARAARVVLEMGGLA